MRVDVWFYEQRGDKVVVPSSSTVYVPKPVADVFPLTELPFNGVMVPVPKNYRAVLQRMYGSNYTTRLPCNPK